MVVVRTRSDCEKPRQLLQFYCPPTKQNARNEVVTHDMTDWEPVPTAAYGTVSTGSGLAVWKARSSNPEVAAVFECDWTPELDAITSRFAIKVNNKFYQILSAINVDEANAKMAFWCRHSSVK